MIVVIATKYELELIKDLKPRKVIITGVGGINVIKTLSKENIPEEELIINVGYAGSNTHKIGQTVEINKVELLHENCEYEQEELKMSEGNNICYTSTDFVVKTNKKGIFDMELAYIVALHPNTKAYKTISDNLDYDEYSKVEGA